MSLLPLWFDLFLGILFLFDAVINVIVFLISLVVCCYVYKDTAGFRIFIYLYSEALLSSY